MENSKQRERSHKQISDYFGKLARGAVGKIIKVALSEIASSARAFDSVVTVRARAAVS